MYIIVQQQIMAASVHIHLMRVLLSYVLLSNALAADASPTAPAPKFDKLRSLTSACEVNEQVEIIGGQFYMGSQYYFGDKVRSFRVVTCGIDNLLRKIMAAKPPDGANARRQRTVQSFHIDRFAVSNAQFDCFVQETGYVTETEGFGWSFVFEPLASKETISLADDPEKGLGRVKDSTHWLGVHGVSYRHPHGPDSDITLIGDHPVVQVSYKDASDYCKWAGARLPTEREWEFAARGGYQNLSYPWGKEFLPGHMNIWEGAFPNGNILDDGFLGTCPVNTYYPNSFGIYNMLGNVWEWVSGGKTDQRVQRGGGFIDTKDGKPNHAVMTSTRQLLSGDSTASSQGFRCASKAGRAPPDSKASEKISDSRVMQNDL